ncbi:MAG TPA: NAD-dependent epimerase/dehydratase family protein [Mucilaginibacter sp.]|jgi:nucleoside-diphosphate-sugar epimerase|nr:NAD-dependent epimerase/dehydratase family protein [Mucilaginibacter sp.]
MILVTGATGFLGSEVAKQLVEQGNDIRCTLRKTSVIPKLLLPFAERIEWVEADLLDIFALEDALEGITQVYNCAAWVSLKQGDKKPMIYTNVTGTANLVNLCLEKHCRLLHVSSVAAVGLAKPGELINEKNQLDHDTETDGYAISKLESEMEVWRGIAEGLDALIVNPSIIIGPNAGTLGSGQLFETVRKGLKFYTAGGMGFVDVEDVAKCMIALMNSQISEERFIINAENWDYKKMVSAIAGHFDRKAPSILAKPWMMEVAWRAAKFTATLIGKAPAIDKTPARVSSDMREFDNSKVKKATGIQFKPMEQSVKEVCEALKVY